MNYYLQYTIGNIKFATPIEEIKEIVRPKNIIKEGELSKNLAGFFDLRGQKVLLYDLPNFLGIQANDKFEVIVAEIAQKIIGFKVGKVLGITASQDLIPFPEIVRAKDYLKGVVKEQKYFLQVISFIKIVSGSRLNVIKKYLE